MSTALRTYIRGQQLVAMRDQVAQHTCYYHFDNQGTTQALTDSTGAVTDRFASDAWGVQVKRTGSSINRRWYGGGLDYIRQVDEPLDYAIGRYYRGREGRFVSPVRPATASGYVYRSNGPASVRTARRAGARPSDPPPPPPKRLATVRCPRVDGCAVPPGSDPCTAVGGVFLVRQAVESDPFRGAEVVFGYKDEGHNDLACQCQCEGGVRWVQMVSTNVLSAGPPGWHVDDINHWGHGDPLTCFYNNHTDHDPGPYSFPGYQFWLEDPVARDVDALKRGASWVWHAVSCLVCVNRRGKGENWVLLDSCVRWSWEVGVNGNAVGPLVFDPAPTGGVSGEELAALRDVFTIDKCPGKWLVSACPPAEGARSVASALPGAGGPTAGPGSCGG